MRRVSIQNVLKKDKELSNRTLHEIIAQMSDHAYVQARITRGAALSASSTSSFVRSDPQRTNTLTRFVRLASAQTFVKSGGMLKLVQTCAHVVNMTASHSESQSVASDLGVHLKSKSGDFFKNLEAVTKAAAAKKAIKTVLDSQDGMNALLQSEESFFQVPRSGYLGPRSIHPGSYRVPRRCS